MRQESQAFPTADMQAELDAKIQLDGSDFVIRETGETFRGLTQFLSQADMPVIAAEYEASNAFELNPLQIWAMDRSSTLKPLQNVHFLNGPLATADDNNYLVETVDSDMLANVEIRRYALLYKEPILAKGTT